MFNKSIEKTESEWRKTIGIDHFYLSWTPKWFQFVEWLIILGVLEYTRRETKSILITLLYFFSILMLQSFISTVADQIPFYKVMPKKYIKDGKHARRLSILISILVLIPIIFLLMEVITLLSNNTN